MIYLTEEKLSAVPVDWNELVNVISRAVTCQSAGHYSQPVKPYLRYGDPKNRIIAMPAYLGGDIHIAGIKWIASFPDNISKGLPRAHSVTILNNADTGEPVAIFNTALLSIIRTAAVSGLMIDCFNKARPKRPLNIGIVGFGPIGRKHLEMCRALLENNIAAVYLYDLNGIIRSSIPFDDPEKIFITDSWEEVYSQADIMITCTVSKERYINKAPRPGSMHLNVSLRDYQPSMIDHFRDAIIVDDWDEVCREKTDIEVMHVEKGLQQHMTKSIADVVTKRVLDQLEPERPVFFNPMGMGIFDIAIANYYLQHFISLQLND